MTESTDAQRRAWRSLMTAVVVLEGALDRQSQRDGGMPHAYYQVLVVLYETPGRRLTMSELAARLRYSLSRLAHAVTSMERSGWVRRSRSTEDRRVQFVELTDAGIRSVRTVSPVQASEVRAKAFSLLSGEQVLQLEAIAAAIVAGLDGGPVTRAAARPAAAPEPTSL
ncbi:MAG TPA: MarR family transcriptional regulator [Lacisediminihabitans sp.]|uniref:MarR family winged helix-turn-helix transcriptional regulator n=1 Tax=Lacisediminihabitans sp. TaxID=2787631 RepID=UPI002ED7B0CB